MLVETLQFVHDKGIVHHDIKPENILFTDDEAIKIGDFGVANRNIGTWYYMSPELLLGERVGSRDPRVDIYALGLTLLELLTKIEPFDRMTRDETLQAKIRHDFIPSELPIWVQEIVLKATHPTPELRFQSMSEFREAIDSRHVPYILDGNRIEAHRLAEEAEALIARKKWKAAAQRLDLALRRSENCVAALVAAGRLELLLRHVGKASDKFYRAVGINPRVNVQKELGWIQLERGNYPQAISMLNDYLQRNAADFEACNLLLQCFYFTNRYEQGEDLAALMISKKSRNDCFVNQRFICRLLAGQCSDELLQAQRLAEILNPFVQYNLIVATESPSSWEHGSKTPLKSKLLFQDYRFGVQVATNKANVITATRPNGPAKEFTQFIIGVGRLASNEICISESGHSRRHAVIVNYPDDVWIYDLGSVTGVKISGEHVDRKAFVDGVPEVEFGSCRMTMSSKRGLLV